MVVATALSSMAYILPIFAFLLVFVVVYALLIRTEVLGKNSGAIALFISFIIASFFVVQASLVEFVQFTSAWFALIVMSIFFAMVLLAFVPGKNPLEFLVSKNWFSWVLIGLVLGMFIIASAYIFNWVLNWGMIRRWFDTDWFGMILLLVVAAIVSWKIK